MSLRLRQRIQNVITTTDGTQTTILTFTVPTGSSISVEANVVGRETTTADTVVAKQMAAAKRAAGAPTLSGSVVAMVTTVVDTALLGASVTIDISGNDIRVRVTGVLAKTVEWFADMDIWIN